MKACCNILLRNGAKLFLVAFPEPALNISGRLLGQSSALATLLSYRIPRQWNNSVTKAKRLIYFDDYKEHSGVRVILTEDIAKLGIMGEMITVKDGFARNYLIPQKLAVPANPQNLKDLEHQKALVAQKKNRIKKEAEILAEKIEKISCTIPKQAGEEDKLFGAVTSKDIEESLKDEGIAIDRKKIVLDEPIKTLGIFKVPIKVHPEVTAHVKIWIVKQ